MISYYYRKTTVIFLPWYYYLGYNFDTMSWVSWVCLLSQRGVKLSPHPVPPKQGMGVTTLASSQGLPAVGRRIKKRGTEGQ